MTYSIKHSTDATSIMDATPEGLAKALRSNRIWPATRYKIIGPPTTTSPPGAIDHCWGYVIKNADGSVKLEPVPTEPSCATSFPSSIS
jgi:hypothetical protein